MRKPLIAVALAFAASAAATTSATACDRRGCDCGAAYGYYAAPAYAYSTYTPSAYVYYVPAPAYRFYNPVVVYPYRGTHSYADYRYAGWRRW